MGLSKMMMQIFIFGLACALQLLFSTSVQTIDVRVLGAGATIVFSKSSPPLASLEDEKLAPLGMEELQRRKVASQQRALSSDRLGPSATKRVAYFRPMRIEKPKIFARFLRAKELVVRFEPEVATANPLIANRDVGSANFSQIIDALPEHLRLRAQHADQLQDLANSDWSEGTVQKALDHLITDAGPPVVPDSVGAFVLKPQPQATTGSGLGVLADPGVRIANTPKSEPQLETVVGAVELGGGLGALDPGQIRVFHRRDGALLRHGEFDFARGEFRIAMAREAGGELVAELRSETDRVLGVGRLFVSDVFKARKPILKVHSTENNTIASAYSADGLGDAVPVAGVHLQVEGLGLSRSLRTNSQGTASTQELDGGSHFEWIASKEGFWTSRTTGHSDWTNRIVMFPDRMMNALFQTLGIQKFDRATGILWGHVRHRGVPIEGVRVSLEDSTGTPVYFSGPFPNDRLAGTSANGQFAFFQLKPGVYQVRAHAKGVELPTKMVEVYENSVSTLDISTSKALSAQVQTYDGVSGEPVTASVQLTGTHRVATASEGRLNLRFSEGVDPLMLDVFAGPQSFTSRIAGDRFMKHQRVPVIRAAWVEEVLTQAGIVHQMARSMIVGFIQGKDFSAEVKLSSGQDRNLGQENRAIYFDGHGNVLRGSERGIAGGGFVIPNLPEGFVQLNLKSENEGAPEGSHSVFVHRMFLDPRVIGVVSKDLGH